MLDCKYPIYRFRASSRLHMTLIDMNGSSDRMYGSMGIALQEPSLEIRFQRSEKLKLYTEDVQLYQFLSKEIKICADRLRVTPNIALEIVSTIPAHIGLGSGTQWKLAILKLLNEIHQLGYDNDKLTHLSGRGGASGIGIYTLLYGGFIIDGGHQTNKKRRFFPVIFVNMAKCHHYCIFHSKMNTFSN
ncbi:hypothetical protein AB835_09240 [Candidatus Endobugula sertula]|uniref:GHMP kinase N-terminal domain-containing protein n=1 Tax=Candidatus Endobugula sertula TaxID=62101 RepID=A0A1D2QPB2_9GAMM|nr:hypothetical protein AB835_09240 [Candidatus Endobugula sertula]